MRPAFDSTRQAAAFALLLLFLLAAPWLSAKRLLPRPQPGYSYESIKWERAPWMQKFIFDDTNDIDIAFVGSSHLQHGIYTPYVQQQLDEQTGRKTVVRSFCWAGSGFDGLYFFTRDLLDHHRVKTLVFYDEASGDKPGEIQMFASHWFRFEDDGGMLAGLPRTDQSRYYFAAVIGMPRNLLALLIPNLPRDLHSTANSSHFWEEGAAEPETTLGCMCTRLFYDPAGEKGQDKNFTADTPQTTVTPADVVSYSPATATNFGFANRPLPAFQTYFAGQFGWLAKNHGCNLVLLHPPMYAEKTSSVMAESGYWPALLSADVCMMGIPGSRLFGEIPEPELRRLYCDPVHLNENGQKYFTRLITPALIQFYENHPAR
jgi:hypothetical protein